MKRMIQNGRVATLVGHHSLVLLVLLCGLACSCAVRRSTHEDPLDGDSSVVLTGDDADDDGLDDALDACPSEAEDFDGWQDEDGCPEDDNDGDGVLDTDDLCPLQQFYTDVCMSRLARTSLIHEAARVVGCTIVAPVGSGAWFWTQIHTVEHR